MYFVIWKIANEKAEKQESQRKLQQIRTNMLAKLRSFSLHFCFVLLINECDFQNVFTANIREYKSNGSALNSRMCTHRLFVAVFVNESKNLVASKAAEVVLNFLRRNPRIGIHVDGFYKVELSGNDAQSILESC